MMIKNMRSRCGICVVGLLLTLFSMVVGEAKAQSASAVSDVKFHVFQPKISPESALDGVSISERTAQGSGMSSFAKQQIQSLLQLKASLSASQRKIDSNVLNTSWMLQGRTITSLVPSMFTGIELDEQDHLAVDMIANVTDSLLKQLQDAGVQVLSQDVKAHTIRALIPPAKLEAIAALSDVRFIGRYAESSTDRMTSSSARPQTTREAFAQRAAEVRRQLAAITNSTTGSVFSGQGKVETEGNYAHQATTARLTYGLTGAGLKIGVLSDGALSRAMSQVTGDLPPDCGTGISSPCLTVLTGQTGTGDEGTAMLEIIHDMVPGADLYFARANAGIVNFANNIKALRAAGCQIIVDDVFYYIESPFQDGQAASVLSQYNSGIVTQAINEVTADGAFYFSSAGNEGNIDMGTAGSYGGDYNEIAGTGPTLGYSVHDFGEGVGYDNLTTVGSSGIVGLFWADPLGGSSNDYDLFILNSANTAILGGSANTQDGTQDPVELISGASAGMKAVVSLYDGESRYFQLINFRGTLQYATNGETHGHSSATGGYSVAATPASFAYSFPTPDGPYPNAFSTSNQIESFSSDGPRRIFFNADSSPITPGDLSSTGGRVLNKPDITAADGVSVTGVGGFGSPFYGTSAAAPSAASVAALVLAAKPTITAAEMKTALTTTAVDIMGSGLDRDSGSGIVMAMSALQSLGITGAANPELQSVVASENPGNSNNVIEPGEGAVLQVQLRNTGVLPATGITATLTTTTPGVILANPATTTFPDMAVGATGVANQSPLLFTLDPSGACGQLIQFTLTLQYSGGQTRALNFSMKTAEVSITNTLGATPTVPSFVTFNSGTQAGRLARTGVTSVCGTTKSYPGISGSIAHTYDSYSFQTCKDACLTPELVANSLNLFVSAYSPTYNPASMSTNFAGDGGYSYRNASFGISTTTGTTYTLVVNDVSGNTSANTYTLKIPYCSIHCAFNALPIAKSKDVTVTAAAFGGTASASIDDGSNDPNGGAVTLTQYPAGPYPVGTTPVILTATNPSGAFAQSTSNVTVLNPANVELSASSLGFGSQAYNNISAPQTVTVTNIGGVPLLFIADPVISGANAAEFSVVSGSTCTANTQLQPAGSCTVSVVFTPAHNGLRAASLVLNNSAVNSPQSVSLSGTGYQMPTTTVAANAAVTYSSLAQNVTLTATVTPAVDTVNTGQVTFRVLAGNSANGTSALGTLIGTATTATVVSGAASVSYALPAGTTAGTYTVLASYSDETSAYNASSDSSHTLTINPASTTVSLTSSINPVLVNTATSLRATVSSAAGVPTGTVTFYDGATPVGTASLSAGVATLSYSSATTGSKTLTASYAATTNYAASASAALTQVVFEFTIDGSTSGTTTPKIVTVMPGGSAYFNFLVAPSSGTTFPAKVTLGVAGLPTGAIYSFSPTEIAAGASATSVMLNITLPSQTAQAPVSQKLAPLVLALLLLPFARRMRRMTGRLGQLIVLGVVLLSGFAGVAGLTGCGSKIGFFATPAQNYTVTFTATSGGASHSTTATLTVQ